MIKNRNMLQIAIRVLSLACAFILFISPLGCNLIPGQQQPTAPRQVITVQRGNLLISVSVDGSLVMSQAFDLRFGAPGNVEEVLVEEGDFVKAGTLLARLDDTSQQLDIKSANCALQLTLSNLYETIPGIQQVHPITTHRKGDPAGERTGWDQTDGINFGNSSYYPNPSSLLSVGWAQEEVAKAYRLFQLNNYGEAVLELRLAVSDLESCIKIFQDFMESSKSGLGDVELSADNAETIALLQEYSYGVSFTLVFQEVVELIKQGKVDLEKVQALVAQGKYAEAGVLLGEALSRMQDIALAVKDKAGSIKVSYDQTYPSKDLCLYFYQAAADKLNQALTLIKQGGLSWLGYNEQVRTALHYMELLNSIMGSNVMVLEHGLSLKNYQQNNVELAKAAVTLGTAKDNLLKTVVIAPFDGTVVSVGVKENDVLSAVDYSSKTAVQLVDTTTIKFQGLVDEIDILKIKTGQKATLAVDAVPEKKFTGRVTFISPYGTPDASNVVQFPITIELQREPSNDVELKGSLTATADIAVSTSENVLLLPITAISTTQAGSSVTVIIGPQDQTEKRQVTLGQKNQQFAEIVSGLKEGDKVVLEQKLAIGAPVIQQPQRPQPKPQGR